MGSTLSSCQWLQNDGSNEYRDNNGLMLASRKTIKPSRIPLSQLCLSDAIKENETEDVSPKNYRLLSSQLPYSFFVSF